MTPSTREKVEAAKAILATDEGPLTLRRIATAVGTSPFHLCRAFAALTGSTMSDYRASQRLHRALERLRESVGLAELAFELGFSSHSHFTAAFRRRFGVTPSAFRAARPPRRPPSTESVRVAARHEPAFSASS